MRRRDFVGGLAASAALQAFAAGGPQAVGLKTLGQPQPFDYAWLKGQRPRAGRHAPTVSPTGQLPAGGGRARLGPVPVDPLPRRPRAVGRPDSCASASSSSTSACTSKRRCASTRWSTARRSELAYDPEMFDYGKSGLQGRALPKDLGFAGFRLNFHTDLERDVCAFLGASYFRAVGGEWQYGLSARGLAIDTGLPRPEEFPTLHATSGSSGPAPDASTHDRSMRCSIRRASPAPTASTSRPASGMVMDVDAALYPRKAIERLGIAPLTSMFQYGENDRRMANDWRPEIHDSRRPGDVDRQRRMDLAAAGQSGARCASAPSPTRIRAASACCSATATSTTTRTTACSTTGGPACGWSPRPPGARARCSWSRSRPRTKPSTTSSRSGIRQRKPQPGEELLFGYRLHWGATAAVRSRRSRTCVATRTGIGGVVGQQRKYFSWRFAIDFAGGEPRRCSARKSKVEPVITASRGKVEITSARPLESING